MVDGSHPFRHYINNIKYLWCFMWPAYIQMYNGWRHGALLKKRGLRSAEAHASFNHDVAEVDQWEQVVGSFSDIREPKRMSAPPPKADIRVTHCDVRGPRADSCTAASLRPLARVVSRVEVVDARRPDILNLDDRLLVPCPSVMWVFCRMRIQ